MLIKKKEFKSLFNKLKRLSNNFNNINSSIFLKEIRLMLILRYLLKLNQSEFSKITRLSKGTIHKIENCKSIKNKDKKIRDSIKNLKNYIKSIKNKKIIFNEIYKIYKTSHEFRKLTSERAKEIRKLVKIRTNFDNGIKINIKKEPQNELEFKIYDILNKANIKFETQGIIDSINKKVIVDFVIPSTNNPKIIIEAKQTKSKNMGNQYDILKTFAIMIDHKLYGIKRKNPNAKCIAILSSKEKPIEKLSHYLNAEFLDTDKIFIDSNLNKLSRYILNTLKQ